MSKERPPTSADWAADYLSQVRHVYRRGHHFFWNDRFYQRIEDQLMLQAVAWFICQTRPSAATSNMVQNVVDTIAIMAAVTDLPSEPFRLRGSPAGNEIVFENGVLQLDLFIKEQLREPALLPAPWA